MNEIEKWEAWGENVSNVLHTFLSDHSGRCRQCENAFQSILSTKPESKLKSLENQLQSFKVFR